MTDIIKTEGERNFELAQRNATALAASSLVPQSFQKNVPNVLIAMDMANRLKCSPMLVMQNMHVIHGRPAFSASFLIATLNAGGEWHPLRYEERGTDPHRKDYAMRAVARHKESGDIYTGPWVDWKMIDGEGWSKKQGSKWLTMPGVMFRYRAAALFVRLNSPETAMGIYTVEEVVDIGETRGNSRTNAATGSVLQRLANEAAEAPDSPAIEAEVVEVADYSGEPLTALVALLAGKHDCDEDAVLEQCLPAIGSKATRLDKLTDEEAELARRWCIAELEVSNG